MKKSLEMLNVAITRMQLAVQSKVDDVKNKLEEQQGDFILDHAMVFIIILVLGGIILLALKNYIGDDFTNLVKQKINDFFN